MSKQHYLMLMEDKKQLNLEVIQRHVSHLANLERQGSLVLCGPFQEGGGMVLLQANSKEEACSLMEADPFIREGYKSFTVKTLIEANAKNGYLLAEA